MRYAVMAVAGVVVAGIVGYTYVAATPARWPVEIVMGVDAYEYHKPFFGDRTISQSFEAQSESLAAIHVLIVDFKRAAPQAHITLTLIDQQGNVIRDANAPADSVADDYYLPFVFDEPVQDTQNKIYTVTVSSPDATATAPYAVRLTEDKQNIAFGYDASVSQLFIARQWIVSHTGELTAASAAVLISILLAVLLPWANKSNRNTWIALAIVLLIGTIFQVSVIRYLTGAVGGDAYYYLADAYRMVHGINPLSVSAYRVPFYPVLLIPATSIYIPDLLWGRLVGIAITAGIGISLVYLARLVRMKPALALAAMALLYMNTDFLITSVRPRPYTLFALELLLAIIFLFRIKTIRGAALWGALLGIIGMTRQEAYVPIAFLGVSFAVLLWLQTYSRKDIAKRLGAAALPLVIILSPYFYANAQQYGSPFAVWQYSSRDDLHVPDTFHGFWYGNVEAARNSLGAVWLPASSSGLPRNAGPQFLITLAIITALYVAAKISALKRIWSQYGVRWHMPDILAGIMSIVLAWSIFRWQLFSLNAFDSNDVNFIIAAAMAVGVVEIIRSGKWKGFLVVLVLGSQLLIATLFHPEPKHYQQTYPILALGIASVLLWSRSTTIWQNAIRNLPVILAVAYLGTINVLHVNNAIDGHNYPAAAYYVTTSAAEQLEHYPLGEIAAEVDYKKGDGIYRLHTYQQSQFIRLEDKLPEKDQIGWLCDNNIRYVLDHHDLDLLTVHTKTYKDHFSLLYNRHTRGRNDRQFQVDVFEFTGNRDTLCGTS